MKFWEKPAVVTESVEIVQNKGLAAFLLCSDLKPHEFTTEVISVWVEKSGKNVDVAKEILVKDLILLGTYNEDTIQKDGTLLTVANIELTKDLGFVHLTENETIKFKLRNLIPEKVYQLHGVEGFEKSNEILMYERKSMGSEDVSRDFNVMGYDIASLQTDASITEIALTHDKGNVAKFSLFELKAWARSFDAANYIDGTTIKVSEADRIVFPLKNIVNVNVRKEPGVRLDFSLRIDESDYIRYQMPAK